VGYLQSIVLGIVQGMTEFLPVSSDGHLTLTYKLFNQMPDLAFEVFLHGATLLAMFVYFRHDIVVLAKSFLPAGKGTAERRLSWLIVLATLISGVLALAIKPIVESANESMFAIGAGFFVTAGMLLAAEALSRHAARAAAVQPEDLGVRTTALIAVAQAAAALPGVSRSGLTISAGMLAGMTREGAARFSFLLGIPLIAAASLVDAKDVLSGAVSMPAFPVALVGFIAAGISGYLAIAGLLAYLRTRPLYVFAVYTCVMGIIAIAWGVLG
jgi:undecaprenyl-diphosphatase